MTETVETPIVEAPPIVLSPLEKLLAYIALENGERVVASSLDKNELSITVALNQLTNVMIFLRDNPNCAFQQLMDITAVDYPSREQRFEVVYHLLSVTQNHRIRVKVLIDEDTAVETVVPLYPTANWFEREVFDMYGVLFNNHPDLRRILTDYGFDGHPLRKDFPLTGFVELRYSQERKACVYEPVKLQQDYRAFDFLSPWEGMTDVMLPGDEKAVKPKFMPRELDK